MNIHALNTGLKPPEPPLEKVAESKALSEEQKVAELSRQFEGVLLRQILGQARKTVFHSKTDEDSATSAIYQDMVTAQLAESISKSGSFGLAKGLETQLSRQVLNHTENPHDATAKKPALSPLSHEAK
jgi:Rod binding domain-containing protein